MSRVSALTRKSIADVTFRRGRSLLVICGIMIGILGLTAVNSASSTIGNALNAKFSPGVVANQWVR